MWPLNALAFCPSTVSTMSAKLGSAGSDGYAPTYMFMPSGERVLTATMTAGAVPEPLPRGVGSELQANAPRHSAEAATVSIRERWMGEAMVFRMIARTNTANETHFQLRPAYPGPFRRIQSGERAS